MTPCKATFAVKVSGRRCPVAVVVMSPNGHILAEANIKDIRRVLEQYEKMEQMHGVEQEDR